MTPILATALKLPCGQKEAFLASIECLVSTKSERRFNVFRNFNENNYAFDENFVTFLNDGFKPQHHLLVVFGFLSMAGVLWLLIKNNSTNPKPVSELEQLMKEFSGKEDVSYSAYCPEVCEVFSKKCKVQMYK